MQKTFKYRIYPTKKQTEKLCWTLEICRWVYNFALADRQNFYKKNGKSLHRVAQQHTLRDDKLKYPLLRDVYAQVLIDVLRRVERSYQNFFRRVKEKKEKAGFPRFKGEDRYDSFTYTQSGFKTTPQGLQLSKIGTIKIKLHRPIQGDIKTCTIRRDVDRWYACFSVEYEPIRLAAPINEQAVGIDVGLKSFAVLSTGEVIDNPKHLRKSEHQLTIKQRQLSKKKRGSSNRKKARLVVAKTHRKIKEQRSDFHHKLSRRLVNDFGYIAVENLNIKGMVRNHHLAKSISDAGWGQFINFVFYKAEEAGSGFKKVAPQKTSILCSWCGEEVPKTLATRTHRCPHCGLVLCRDHNAAINILSKATAGTAESYTPGEIGPLPERASLVAEPGSLQPAPQGESKVDYPSVNRLHFRGL